MHTAANGIAVARHAGWGEHTLAMSSGVQPSLFLSARFVPPSTSALATWFAQSRLSVQAQGLWAQVGSVGSGSGSVGSGRVCGFRFGVCGLRFGVCGFRFGVWLPSRPPPQRCARLRRAWCAGQPLRPRSAASSDACDMHRTGSCTAQAQAHAPHRLMHRTLWPAARATCDKGTRRRSRTRGRHEEGRQ